METWLDRDCIIYSTSVANHGYLKFLNQFEFTAAAVSRRELTLSIILTIALIVLNHTHYSIDLSLFGINLQYNTAFLQAYYNAQKPSRRKKKTGQIINSDKRNKTLWRAYSSDCAQMLWGNCSTQSSHTFTDILIQYQKSYISNAICFSIKVKTQMGWIFRCCTKIMLIIYACLILSTSFWAIWVTNNLSLLFPQYVVF